MKLIGGRRTASVSIVVVEVMRFVVRLYLSLHRGLGYVSSTHDSCRPGTLTTTIHAESLGRCAWASPGVCIVEM